MALDNKLSGNKLFAFEINNIFKAIRQLYQSIFDLNRALDLTGVAASDTERFSLNTEKASSYNATPVLLKKFKVYKTGTIRLKFDYKSNNQNYTAYLYGQIDGASVFSDNFSNTIYQNISHDISVSNGDYVEIWGYGSTSTAASIKNLKICYDETVVSGSDYKIITD